MPEENENLETVVEPTEWEEVDYKALYEKEKERADKRQSRFKSAKAQEKEKAQYEIDDSYIDRKVKEELFFEKNSTASEFRKEIKEIQAQYAWMDVQTAFNLYLAQNKPDMLAKPQSSTWVEWITPEVQADKPLSEQTDEEFMQEWNATHKR